MMDAKERLSFEKKIIASLLQTETNFTDVISFGLTDDIFQSQLCKEAYKVSLKYIFEFDKFPSFVDLFQFLLPTKNTELKKFILELSKTPTELMVMPLVKYLLEQTISDELNEIATQIHNTKDFGIDLASEINSKIAKIIYKYYQKYVMERPLSENLEELIKNILDSIAGKENQYIPSGLENLDKYIIGFHKHSVCVIGARPGIGKTAFMLQINRNMLKQGYKTGVISIEMDTESLLVRDVSANCKINSIQIESGRLDNTELQAIENEIDILKKLNYHIDEDAHQTPAKIMATINKWKVQHKIDVILIDYLQLIKPDETADKFHSRHDLVIGQIMEEFRKFTKATGTPIILLSQLNRNNETRQDKMPQLSDLRESGAIEQDARQVLFLHSPDHYDIDPFDGKTNNNYCLDNTLLTKEEFFMVIIAKNRGGLTGYCTLRYLKPIHTFEDVIYKFYADTEPTISYYEPKERKQIQEEFPI